MTYWTDALPQMERKNNWQTARLFIQTVPMPLKLTITKTNSATPPEEQIFKSSDIRIGRHPKNDLCLDDPYISRFHAQIIQRNPRLYQLVSFKEDRTKLHGRFLEANHPVDLVDGDRVELPTYSIEVKIFEETSTAPPPIEEKAGTKILDTKPGDKTEIVEGKALEKGGTLAILRAPRNKKDIYRTAKKLALQIRETYTELFYDNKEKRVEALNACIDKACLTYILPKERKQVLFFTNKIIKSSEHHISFSSWEESSKKDATRDPIAAMAKGLNIPPPAPDQEIELKQFEEHWSAVVKLLLDALFDRILFSEEIKKQYEESSSPSLLSESNPLRNITSINQLSECLLNWKKEKTNETCKNLRELLDHMIIQQKALIENTREGYRIILDDLSPEAIEQSVDAQDERTLAKKLFRTKHQKLWDQLIDNHKKLVERTKKGFTP